MVNKQSHEHHLGFSLVETLIVIALILIISSIALHQYHNYTQQAANNACLTEASTLVSNTILKFVINANIKVDENFTYKACASGSVPTYSQYMLNETLIFVPKSRGASAELKNILCNAGNGVCVIDTN